MSLGPPATIRLLLRSSTVMRRSVSCTPGDRPLSVNCSGRPLPLVPACTESVPPVVGPDVAAPVAPVAPNPAPPAAPAPRPGPRRPGPRPPRPRAPAGAQEELLEQVGHGGGVALLERQHLDHVLGGRGHVEGVDQRVEQFHRLVRRRDEQAVAVLVGRDEDVFQHARFDDLAGFRVDELQRRGLGDAAGREGRARGAPRSGRAVAPVAPAAPVAPVAPAPPARRDGSPRRRPRRPRQPHRPRGSRRLRATPRAARRRAGRTAARPRLCPPPYPPAAGPAAPRCR